MTGRLAECVDLLGRLVAYPTISADSNLDMIADLAGRLAAAGARVETFGDATGTKANLWATLGPDAPGGLVLSGHTDVVPAAGQDWSSDPFRMRADGGRLYGRGTCDMKGFIAAAVAMAPEFARRDLKRPVHFAFTHDEEVGCLGARALVPLLQARGLRPAMAVIGEPTSMRPIEGHKGCCEYSVRFSGLSGHGSAPERGVNAAEYAVRYVARLLELRRDLIGRAPAGSRFDPPWTTINLGRIAGGSAHNVIAERAAVDWEMRPVQAGDADFVLAEIAAHVADRLLPAMRALCPEADIATEVVGEVAGLVPRDANPARDLVAAALGTEAAGVVPFGTEAGLYQQIGLSVVVCGPGSIEQAHRPDEFVEIEQLGACLDLLERLGHASAQAGVLA